MPSGNQQVGKGTPTANYPIVKATNADAEVWGALLLSSRHVGAIRSEPLDGQSRPAAPGMVVEAMDDNLLVGVFSDDPEVWDSGEPSS